jgi:hypothetical protein
MASSPEFVVAFVVVAVLCRSLFVVVADSFEVSLNNITPPADLVLASTSPPPLLPPRPRDLRVFDSPSLSLLSATPSKQPLLVQIKGRLSSYPPGAGPKNLPPPGIRLRAPFTASDEKPPNQSVVRCGPQRLGRPLFNQRKARFFHPAVLVSGDTSTHRRRVLPRPRLGVVVALVQGPPCNTTFFEGSFVIWLLNIYRKMLFVKKHVTIAEK